MFPVEMAKRAMPSVIAKNDIIYIWGGYQFEQRDSDTFDSNVWTFNAKSGIFGKVDAKNFESAEYKSGFPPIRYGAPVTSFGEKYFILYGGVTYPEHALLSDVWRYEFKTNTWEELFTDGKVSKPLKVRQISGSKFGLNFRLNILGSTYTVKIWVKFQVQNLVSSFRLKFQVKIWGQISGSKFVSYSDEVSKYKP